HMYAAGQAGIEATYSAHNINAFEFLRSILLENRCILNGIFVGARSAIDIAWAGIPGRRWIGMVVRDLAVFDHHMVRKHAAHGFVEATANRLFGHGEVGPGGGTSRADLVKCFLNAVQGHYGRVRLEIGTRSVSLKCIAPPGNFPLDL